MVALLRQTFFRKLNTQGQFGLVLRQVGDVAGLRCDDDDLVCGLRLYGQSIKCVGQNACPTTGANDNGNAHGLQTGPF